MCAELKKDKPFEIMKLFLKEEALISFLSYMALPSCYFCPGEGGMSSYLTASDYLSLKYTGQHVHGEIYRMISQISESA